MFVILLNDLSKAFDCLNHDLLIVKLNAYGFSLTALRLIHDYLLSRKQRTKINNSYNTVLGTPSFNTWLPLVQHFPSRFVLHSK